MYISPKIDHQYTPLILQYLHEYGIMVTRHLMYIPPTHQLVP